MARQRMVHRGGAARHRELISASRARGRVVDWHGGFGWVQPFYPVNHPDAGKRNGYLYLAQEDLAEDFDSGGDANCIVSFVIYRDSFGLGAAECQSVNPFQSRVFTGSHLTAPVHRGGGRYGSEPRQVGADGRRSRRQPSGKDHQAMARPSVSPEQLANQLYSALTDAVWEAVQSIAHLEETWTPEDLSKRVVRYLYKGFAANDFTALHWPDAVKQYIEKATWGYINACAEKPWFLELDLAPALVSASWCIAKARGGLLCPQFEDVEKLATEWHQVWLDKPTVDKVLFETLEFTFPHDERCRTKLYNALSKSYCRAFEAVSMDVGPAEDFQRAERFMREWVNDSICRAWGGVPNPEELLTDDALTELFKCLVAPADTEFSCVPAPLVEGIERSPEEWEDFLRQLVQGLFSEWANPEQFRASTKRRKTMEAEGGVAQFEDVEKLATEEHQVWLDKPTVDKFLLETLEFTFPDEERCRIKLYNALSKSYCRACEAVSMDGGPAEDFQRAEQFMREWVNDSICRAWGGVPNPEDLLTDDTLTELFTYLVAPADSEFSCIPAPLVEGIERSPEEWEDFLRQLMQDLFSEWTNAEQSRASPKRRKTTEAEGGEDAEDEAEEE